jgi:putative ABC transport system permease protein
MGWLRQLFTRRRRYDELSVSIREHLEEKIADLTDHGMTQEEAERTARREFGNVTQIEERSREVWQWPTVESIVADLRFAVRQLYKSPGFTTTAVLTLGLGIGVNATMFSLISAFLMPRLPGHDPQNVIVVSSVNPNQSFHPDVYAVSVPNYLAWRADTHIFSALAADADSQTGSLSGHDQPEAIRYAAVSLNYFDIFAVRPTLGRAFIAGEDTAGRNHAMILSYGLWKRRYGADTTILGRTVRLNREDYTIVGVMGPGFRLLGYTPQLWIPLTLSGTDVVPAARRDRHLFLFARLAPGVTLEQARAEMNSLALQAQRDYPDIEKRWGASVRTLSDYLVYEFDIRNSLYVIMTMVGFVLLIACVNVAGLLLTRGAGRQKELAIRVSLGASRRRVVRQLLTEGVTLALVGGAVGLFLSVVGIRLLRAALTFNEAISSVPLSLDERVLTFALFISLASALLSSLAPALKASHTHIDADLRSETRTSSAGRANNRLRSILVGGEIAMALFLLMASSLIVYGIYKLDHQRLGFRSDHLLTAGVVLDHERYSNSSHQLQFVQDLIPRLEQVPGVEDAAVTSDLPSSGGRTTAIRFPGEPPMPNSEQRTVIDVRVTPDYFEVAGISLLRGRTFTAADKSGGPRAVVVNQEFVRRYLQGHDALGKRLQLSDATQVGSEIVGVVSDIKYSSEGARILPEVYEPISQDPANSISFMIRTSVDPNSLLPELRHILSGMDPDLPLLRAMSMDEVIQVQHNGDPVFSQMLGIFALLALLLAAIGIYGLIAYSVVQRTHEIGIRVALGAKRSDVSWMILREGITIAVIGSSIGLALAVPLPKLFDSMFSGFHFAAPVIYPIVLSATLVVSAVSSWIPARRASRVDPTAALRAE